MKTPEPHKENPSAPDKRIFSYPKQRASACAEVLARLLSGEVLTAADTLNDASTMRAASHIHYLAKRYNWPIVAEDRATGCTDGRLTKVSTYRLPAGCIRAARADSATGWIVEVMAARAALRAKAPDAFRRAAAMNKAKERPTPQPWQPGLFEEGAT